MKTYLSSILLTVIFTFLILLNQSCSVKLPKELQEIQNTQYTTSWEELRNYPIKRGRSDDLHFFSPLEGFVINSQGYLSYTKDGGDTWKIVYENKGTFLRCISFKNRDEGWIGTIGTDDKHLRSNDTIPMYETKDGGKSWSPVKFIGPTPKGLCGLQKVTDNMIVGTGRVRGPSFFIKTMDGGLTWHSYDLNHLAGSLISAHFIDENHGFIIGGTTQDKKNSRSLVLETFDSGATWDTIFLSDQIGEYPWKFSFPSKNIGYISIQRNNREGRTYYLATKDGGKTWSEQSYSRDYYYTQGIGFIDEKTGWIGGSNSATYETRDSGNSWKKIKNVGRGFNNFQFFGDSLAYGVGFGVFKFSKNSKKKFQKEYYADGSLRGKYEIKRNGKRAGAAKIFYPSGKLKSQGSYKNNLKDKNWKYYDESGNLITESSLKDGIHKLSKKDLEAFVGTYELERGGYRKIILEDQQLYSQKEEGNKLPIFSENKNLFYFGFNPDITIEFIKNDKNEMIKTKTYQRGQYSFANKVPVVNVKDR